MGSSTGDGRRTTLFVLAGGNFAQLGIRFLLGALVPLILLDFAATKSSIGLALTGMGVLYALFQFPSGVLADRHGEKLLLLCGLGGATLGAVLVAISPSLLLFGASILVLGAGTGMYFSPASSLVSRLYDAHGGPLSTLTAFGSVAGIVYPALGGVIAVRTGWRTTVALSVLVTLPVLFLMRQVVPSPSSGRSAPSRNDGIELGRYRHLLTRPGFAYSVGLAVIVGFTFQGFASFFPTFLIEYHGVQPELAGVTFGAVFGLSSLAQPVAGRFSDRFSRDLAIGTSVTLTIAGFTVLLSVPTRLGLLVGSGLLGVGISWPGPIQARLMDQLDATERGFGFGLARTMYMLLAAAGSVVVGTLADVGGWVLGYGFVVGLLAGCLILLGANRALSLEL